MGDGANKAAQIGNPTARIKPRSAVCKRIHVGTWGSVNPSKETIHGVDGMGDVLKAKKERTEILKRMVEALDGRAEKEIEGMRKEMMKLGERP